MELYKLQLSVTLVRYNAEPKEAPKRLEDIAREAAEGEGGDPVKRDNQQISGMPVAKILDNYLDRVNAPPQAMEMPEAQIDFRRTYDVAADSLADAAAFCKKFEAVAEGIGVPAPALNVPPRIVAFPGGRF